MFSSSNSKRWPIGLPVVGPPVCWLVAGMLLVGCGNNSTADAVEPGDLSSADDVGSRPDGPCADATLTSAGVSEAVAQDHFDAICQRQVRINEEWGISTRVKWVHVMRDSTEFGTACVIEEDAATGYLGSFVYYFAEADGDVTIQSFDGFPPAGMSC